jgi:hypothetical protein
MNVARWVCSEFAVQVLKWTVAILESNLAGIILDAVSYVTTFTKQKHCCYHF